jgi:hypothetical protein
MSMARYLLAVYSETLIGTRTRVLSAGFDAGVKGDGLQSESPGDGSATLRPDKTCGRQTPTRPAMSGSSTHDMSHSSR